MDLPPPEEVPGANAIRVSRLGRTLSLVSLGTVAFMVLLRPG
jgi:hypothetical protein